MTLLALKLVLAHILGDFVFHPDRWVKDKEERKIKSKYLYYHLCLHAFLLAIALSFNAHYLIGFLCIIVSHFLIDVSKLYLAEHINIKPLFLLDQLAHLGVIAGVLYSYEPYTLDFSSWLTAEFLLLVASLITCSHVVSIIIRLLLSSWDAVEESENSLNKAGTYIGMLERIFVFFFIISGQWSGIGFLIAAKSVFRFGDLSKAKDRKLTEYILIGTLLSFGFAIITAKVYLYLKASV